MKALRTGIQHESGDRILSRFHMVINESTSEGHLKQQTR